ncbi:hypothetical protein, partial [Myroides sp. DF42-4-2]|uniref:hypothetical protein n=1 Tax=Myroides sp. DF42-4-2 TaxID=2746726 RepID=UPI0025786125
MKSTLDLIKLAGLKTNLSVDANNYSTLDLIKIVGFVGIHQRHFVGFPKNRTVVNSKLLTLNKTVKYEN